MINRIHQILFRPERGWDPVPGDHVNAYGQLAWENLVDPKTLDWIESVMGSMAGKKVLDLGGGPGQYSVALAHRGAQVTWHDISAGYQSFARRKAEQAGVNVAFSLGYLEDAKRFGEAQFDLVFCRSCWYYSIADRSFANVIYRLIRPGGCGFINTPLSSIGSLPPGRRLQQVLYQNLGFKIGHPMPSAGRLASLMKRFPLQELQTRWLEKNEDEVLFRKPL